MLFVDEIQESEKFISELKFICENYPNVNIICAGSLLVVKLRRSHFSFPVGKGKILTLCLLDFEKNLMAINEYLLISEIKKCFENNTPMIMFLHERCIKNS